MFSISVPGITSMLEGLRSRIDSGGLAGSLKVYTGPRPRSGEAVTSQILLVDFSLQYPCGSADEGVLTFSPISDEVAIGEGTAAWARISTSGGVFVMDLDVGKSDSSSDVKINDSSVSVGNTISISTLELRISE